jgi:GT2 family glycosyltransferase
MNKNNKLSFIIPTINTFDLCKNCIESIIKYEGRMYPIVVIDDGTQDELIKSKLREYCESNDITVIFKDKNEGFPRTVNTGLKYAQTDYFLVINNDVLFTQKLSDDFLTKMESDDKLGIIGCLLFYRDQKTIQHGGILEHMCRFYHIGQFKTVEVERSVLVPRYMIAVTGAIFGLRKEMLDQIGYLRDDYFLAMDDMELCLRAWKNNWRTYYHPQMRGIHLEGETRGSSQESKKEKGYYWLLKEEQTFNIFMNDIKGYDLKDIHLKISKLNKGDLQ